MPTLVVEPRGTSPRDSFLRRHRHLCAAVSAAALLAVVAATPMARAALNDKHTEGRWTLVEAPSSVPLGLNMTIKDQHLSGRGPCNYFGSRWSQDDGPGKSFLSTAMGCVPDTGDEENAYFTLLTGTVSVHVLDGQLVLSGKAGTLVYERRD